MTDVAWIDAILTSARPQAVAALLRYFRDLDTAEEAFQEACLRALKSWPQNGPPRDAAAWLILVGRNVAIDSTRRRSKQQPLPAEEVMSDLDDAEAVLVERLDDGHYRDDILRLLFICCHPDLPSTQQIALALRVVSGLSVKEIARAFLVNESAMEQRITRAKRRVAEAEVPFQTPGAPERAERLAAVAAMIYLLFNEGYSASGGAAHVRAPLCDEAIRLARLLLRLFQAEPEVMGLTALLLLQHARTCRAPGCRRDHRAAAGPGSQPVEPQDDRRGLCPHRQGHAPPAAGPLPGPGRHRGAACAGRARPKTRIGRRSICSMQRSRRLQPSPVVTLNRAVAVAKVHGPAAALAMIEPLASQLSGYFYFFGVKGALLMQVGRPTQARVAFDQAIALANTPAEAAHIRMQLDRLMHDSAPADSPQTAH